MSVSLFNFCMCLTISQISALALTDWSFGENSSDVTSDGCILDPVALSEYCGKMYLFKLFLGWWVSVLVCVCVFLYAHKHLLMV